MYIYTYMYMEAIELLVEGQVHVCSAPTLLNPYLKMLPIQIHAKRNFGSLGAQFYSHAFATGPIILSDHLCTFGA